HPVLPPLGARPCGAREIRRISRGCPASEKSPIRASYIAKNASIHAARQPWTEYQLNRFDSTQYSCRSIESLWSVLYSARTLATVMNYMLTPRFAVAALLLPLFLAGCPSEQPRFVKPVATPIDPAQTSHQASKYQDGYLRIFVSSNLDSTGKMMDFGKGKDEDKPAMLLISAKFGKGTVASFNADAEPEIPVLLYDVRSGNTQSSVVNNAMLTEGMLVDPESLSRSPHLQIFVRGVPADKATWVTDLLELATDEPILKVGLNFVPGGAAFSPLSTKLGSMLSNEIKTTNKPWEEKTLLGMRIEEGLASLNGRQFVVLLNPSTIELEAPPKLMRCDTRGSLTGLCEGDGKPWTPKQAYVRFELNVTDFRSIK